MGDLRAQSRNVYRDAIAPGSATPNDPEKAAIRALNDGLIDKIDEAAQTALAGRRAFATLAARNAWTDRPTGAIAAVEETGLNYRWDNTTWAVFTDPLIEAADRAEAAQAVTQDLRDEASGFVAPVSNLVASGTFDPVAEFELSSYRTAQRTADGFLIDGDPLIAPPLADPSAPMAAKGVLIGIGHSFIEQGFMDALASALADPSRLGVTLPSANLGLSGATARAIALQDGAKTVGYQPAGGVIPATVSRVVLSPADSGPCDAFGDGDQSRLGLLGGVLGTFDWRASDSTMGFTRERAGRAVSLPVAAPFVPIQYDRDTLALFNGGFAPRREVVEAYREGFVVFWAHRNSFASANPSITQCVREAIQYQEAMVERLRPQQKAFVILSEWNSASEPSGSDGYKRVMAINTALAARWPREFIDVRTPLASGYAASQSGDITDKAADIPVRSLRSDGLHPNASGRAAAAALAANAIMARGLMTDVQI